MPASKLKNLVILILLFANLFLLALAVPSYLEKQTQAQTAASALSELFAQAEVTLDPSIIPSSPELYPQEVSCAPADNLAAVTALLGDQVISAEQAFRTDFRSASGTAYLTIGGEFRCEPTAIASDDPHAETVRLLEKMGGEWDSVSHSGELYFAAQKIGGVPVLSNRLSFSWKNGELRVVSGRLVAGETARRAKQTPSCTAQDALLAFYASRLELGWVGSRIESVQQGFVIADSASPAAVQLIPSWRIATDGGAYLVDGISRAVTPSET
ncbi:MAG: hypothetical protein IJS31_00810 [Oscillospiraceae bacterium]|nr:hypothetical protein [Oscillospiraceae bacterium]